MNTTINKPLKIQQEGKEKTQMIDWRIVILQCKILNNKNKTTTNQKAISPQIKQDNNFKILTIFKDKLIKTTMLTTSFIASFL